MELKDLREDIKLQLFGGILQPEIDDKTLEDLITMSLNELNSYYSITELKTIKADRCIDLKEYPTISTVTNVYRTQSVSSGDKAYERDPVSMSQLQMYNLGSSYYNNDWIYRIMNYSNLQRIANTLSTDLDYHEDKSNKKLYINYSEGMPENITLEYIPKLVDVSQVVSSTWQDILRKLSLAHTKVALGRIRTRFTQDNAIWKGDGETILAEGNSELTDIRNKLREGIDLLLPID